MNGYDLAAGRYGAVVHEASRNGVLAVVFDMDGTLFDSTACVTAAYRDAVVAAGGPSYTATEIVAAYPLGPPARILGHLLGRPASLDEEGAYLALLGEYQDHILLYDGVKDLLTQQYSEPSKKLIAAALAATRLLNFFSVVVGGDAVPRPKPEPDGVLRACDLLGVSPRRAAYVGDSPLDLEAARRSGSLAVGAAWGHLFDPEARCDFVAVTPEALLSSVCA